MCSYKNEGKGIVRDLICDCFEYSVDDINHDFLKNGKSTIMERIQMEKKFGNCRCETKSPTAKWCLGDIRRVVDKLKGEFKWPKKTHRSQLPILKTLHDYAAKELTHDDITLIALEVC